MSVSSRVARASAAILVAITVTALLGGCSWFRKGPRGDYALVQEQRPLEVPPDLTLPDTSGAMALPPTAGGQAAQRPAAPAPTASIPGGSSTNMNSGSKRMLTIPPMVMPKPAFFDSPTLRSRWARVLLSTVGIPPQTMTKKQ